MLVFCDLTIFLVKYTKVEKSRKKESENIDNGVKEWQNNYTYKLLESTVKITYKT